MDRSDERKEDRSGDVLGLGGAVSGNDDMTRAHATESEDEAERRRRRMNEGLDELAPGASGSAGVHRGAGATGIDMGGGGEGTDVE